MNYVKAVPISQSTRIQVNIPKDIQDFLGWSAGDKLMVDQNKVKDQITLTRVKEENQ